MFDIAFTEIVVIALVGLIVIGPSRLPQAMRTCALWIGRFKRTMSNVRRDIENEIGIDEIRQDLRNEQIMAGLKADQQAENLGKEQEKAGSYGNSYLDSAYKNGPQESSTKQAEPSTNQEQSSAGQNDSESAEQPTPTQSKDNNN